jgi:hypothetical protein
VYQLVVLNRLSLTNFVAPLSPGFEWQRQGEYVTFRDRDDAAKSVILFIIKVSVTCYPAF